MCLDTMNQQCPWPQWSQCPTLLLCGSLQKEYFVDPVPHSIAPDIYEEKYKPDFHGSDCRDDGQGSWLLEVLCIVRL